MNITDRKNSRTLIYGGGGSVNTIYADIKEEDDPRDDINERQDEQVTNELPDEIKAIHNTERKNVKGLVLEKQKFFFNKSKIVFLKEGDNPSDKK